MPYLKSPSYSESFDKQFHQVVDEIKKSGQKKEGKQIRTFVEKVGKVNHQFMFNKETGILTYKDGSPDSFDVVWFKFQKASINPKDTLHLKGKKLSDLLDHYTTIIKNMKLNKIITLEEKSIESKKSLINTLTNTQEGESKSSEGVTPEVLLQEEASHEHMQINYFKKIQHVLTEYGKKEKYGYFLETEKRYFINPEDGSLSVTIINPSCIPLDQFITIFEYNRHGKTITKTQKNNDKYGNEDPTPVHYIISNPSNVATRLQKVFTVLENEVHKE